jgi:hypothetical protein
MKTVHSLYSNSHVSRRKRWKVKPDRRTIIVLTTLVSAMTLVSGVLLMMEPGPIQPLAISLQAFDNTEKTTTNPLATDAMLHQWLGIVIHDSGTLQGTADQIDAAHRQFGLGSLGYHFVVHNGAPAIPGNDDGQIVVSERWTNQSDGAYCGGPDADQFNQNAVGVCMIGDFDRQAPTEAQMQSLINLVRGLQSKFGIPADRIWVQTGGRTDSSTGKLFPVATFQRQLRQF